MSGELTLVMGASSDIGGALIGRLLADDAARVIAHHHASGDRIVAHERVHRVAADCGSASAVEQMAADVVERIGVPDHLVYLPGVKLRYERFTRFDMAHFDRDLDIQVRSAIVLCRRLLPAMAKKPHGRIVFVLSSVTRSAPPKFMSMYAVVKYAQLGLMRALAAEYATTPVTVNAVSPSMVETRFLDDIPELTREMAAKAAPRGRLVTPDEVAAAIQFLLSPDGASLNGVELPVGVA